MDLDSDEEIDPITMIFPADGGDGEETQAVCDQDHRHYIKSIDSTVVIRQLPSRGLSFQLWPAATTLVTLLDDHRLNPSSNTRLSALLSPSNRNGPPRILELGSGTGLAGIVAAATLGAYVTVTDLPHVIPNLQFNVEANAGLVKSGSVLAAPLRWGEAEDMEKLGREYDVVLASDVVYHDHLYEPLLESLSYLLGGDGRSAFVMAHLRRWKKEAAFFKRARKLFNVEILFQEAPADGSRVGVVVYGFIGKQHTTSEI
uniref:Uncharacterized protein n=1 Tax=Kalanchoe fedtschenkoi TaxID=63787 RepID=A0A7N1A7M0_KALFE